MYRSFKKKEHSTSVDGNRHDVRKPNIDPSKIGEEIKRPIHLKEKKKELLKEKEELLKQKKKKTL